MIRSILRVDVLRGALSPGKLSIVIAGALAASVAADQLIENYNASLTSYLYIGSTSGKTLVQGVRPRFEQREANIDGTSDAPPEDLTLASSAGLGRSFGFGAARGLGGDWFASGPLDAAGGAPGTRMGSIDLSLGNYSQFEIDLRLPAPGFSWTIGRAFNGRQLDSSDASFDSNGYQGLNWSQLSQPEIVFHDDADDTKDMIYLVTSAGSFVEFVRFNVESSTFKGRNGAVGAFVFTPGSDGEPDLWSCTGQHGCTMVFFGFDANAGAAKGQLWKLIDPAGNTAFVGSLSSGAAAISAGYDGSGRITTAFDTASRRYTYTYSGSAIGGAIRLTQVLCERLTSGTWASSPVTATVATVDYAYYQSGGTAFGDEGNLKQVTVTVPSSVSGVDLVRKRYYRYWSGTFHATTNPGHPNTIQYIVDAEGVRAFDWSDSTWDDDHFTASESSLKPFASSYFTYDSSRRIQTTWSSGACGCTGGSGNGIHVFTYGTNGSHPGGSGYDTAWKSVTNVKFPSETATATENKYLSQYFDEVGQAVSRALTEGTPIGATPSGQWSTVVGRDSLGAVTSIAPPDTVSAFSYAPGTFTTRSSAGRYFTTTRVSSGDLKGFVLETKHSTAGTSGTQHLDLTLTYPGSPQTITVGDITVPRALPSSYRHYTQAITSGTTGSILTSLSYSFHSGAAANMVKIRTVTNPTVSTGNNGSNSATTTKAYMRADGTVAFTENEEGIFSYSGYSGGLLVKVITDAQTNHGSDFASGDDPNGDFGIAETGAGLRQITAYAFDHQGRLDAVTLFANASSAAGMRVQKHAYTRLADQRMVTLGYPDFEAGNTPAYHGPASYRVSNLANRSVFSGAIAFTGNQTTAAPGAQIDDSASDPISAVIDGTLARMQTSIFESSGTQLLESRSYFDIPTSGAGASGTNYDATAYAYNDAGRRWRTKSADGTISRTVFDKLGRTSSQWIGTNDNDAAFPGGETTGTSNMVKLQEVVYDGGADAAPSRVTQTTSFIQGSTSGQRQTSSQFDGNGHAVLTVNPVAPHVLRKFDHLGRVLATGLYSSSSGLTAASDPTSVTSNRIALTEQAFDERGRAWKATRHKIVSGASTDTLTSENWFDAVGRLVKVEGEQLAKFAYDRLGRRIHEYTVARMSSSSYSSALTVSGDLVLEQHDTVFDPVNGQVVMTASIARHPNDYGGGATTGALDTNADTDDLKYTMSDVKGRIQIAATWFDRYGRATDSAFYGTNGGSDFDRDGLGVPTRSDTVLVSSTSYNTDGTVLETTDPKAQKTRLLYDEAGRTIATIGNYTGGSLSSPTRDNDIYTRYTFANGHQTSMWVDIDGDGTVDTGGTGDTNDQVTTYTYGVSKGTSPGDSLIASGSLLQKVTYPDSSGGSDVVTFAYNAPGQLIWQSDQAGNIIETDFDASGRETHRRATNIASGFDDTVKRISTIYDSHGRTELVTSWDNEVAGSGSVLNEIKYAFDGWGNLTSFKQDRDSAVGGSGYYEVSYDFDKAATSGQRQTLRRRSMTLAGKTWSLEYSSSGSLLDSYQSRVTRIKDSSTTVSRYWYLGEGDVVGREYSEPSVVWNEWATGTPATYPDRDQFNRITSSRWTRDRTTDFDFVDLDVTYDRASNVTSVKDNIYTGFDVLYANDGLNRLTDADEGTLSSGSISSRTRRQLWTLSQTGNWPEMQLDLDGNGNYTGTDELDETRTHNVVNEILTRDKDSNASTDYTLTHDAVGNLTDDGQTWKYVYDAFGRLKELRKRSDDSLLAEYTYYGNNFRASEHYDADADGDVDGSDPTYYFAWDEGWRLAAVYRGSDSSPKERFLHHQAGNSGYGGSSYIDSLVLRDRDANTAWTAASDGTLEERRYYCQSWRHDVVAMVTSGGALAERARYSAYGVVFGIPLGDVNGDGACDSTDVGLFTPTPSGVRYDLNLDGTINSSDSAIASANTGVTLGRGKLSNIGNRFGYAGYESDFISDLLMHVRNRVYHATLGRWTRRDPLGYVDGASLYQYVGSRPVEAGDPFGTYSATPCPDNPVGRPVPAAPILKYCCSQARKPGVPARTICCRGIKTVCIFEEELEKKLQEWGPGGPPGGTPASGLALGCIKACEPTHCANATCAAGATGAPTMSPSLHCSECQMYKCAADCVLAACGADPEHCAGCGGSALCEQQMRAFFDAVQSAMFFHCDKCAAEFTPSVAAVVVVRFGGQRAVGTGGCCSSSGHLQLGWQGPVQ